MIRAALLLLLCASSALAQEPLTFKGLALGATKDQVFERFPPSLLVCKADSCSAIPTRSCGIVRDKERCTEVFNYGNVLPEFVSFTFREERLVAVSAILKASSFDRLSAAMQMRFGKPAKDDTSTVQNRMGATFDNRRVMWLGDGNALSFRKRGAKLDESHLFFSSAEELTRRADERVDQMKESAKGL